MKVQKINKIPFIFLCFLFTFCSKNEPTQEVNQQTQQKTKKESAFNDLYELSEMALLMEKMYDDLQNTKALILSNSEMELSFPEEFKKIHTAQMSEGFERNQEFFSFATVYLEKTEQFFSENSNYVENFNQMVNSCIACHKSDSGCIGPINRISKLLIKPTD